MIISNLTSKKSTVKKSVTWTEEQFLESYSASIWGNLNLVDISVAQEAFKHFTEKRKLTDVVPENYLFWTDARARLLYSKRFFNFVFKRVNLEQTQLDEALQKCSPNNRFFEKLLSMGANIDFNDTELLKVAVWHMADYGTDVPYLLSKGANIHAQNDFVLRIAAKHHDDVDFVKFLVEKGCDIHVLDNAPFWNAYNKDNYRVATWLFLQDPEVLPSKAQRVRFLNEVLSNSDEVLDDIKPMLRELRYYCLNGVAETLESADA